MAETEQITDAELAAIEEYCEKATAGEVVSVHACDSMLDDDAPGYWAVETRDGEWLASFALEDNSDFFARARTDLPRVTRALLEARKRIAELEAQRDSLQLPVENETYAKCFTDTNVGDD